MSYVINTFNKNQLTVIADGSVDNTTDLTLVGKNYGGFGTMQNDNFVYLLENFADVTPPSKPITGQIWFDSLTNKLKFFDANSSWRDATGADTSSNFPTNLSEGDFWFDTVNKQLYVYSLSESSTHGPGFVLVGPMISSSTGSLELTTIKDISAEPHEVFIADINGEVALSISPDATYQVSTDNAINGFPSIHHGLSLPSIAFKAGDTEMAYTTVAKFWGTATTANGLTLGGDNPVAASIDVPTSSDKTTIPVRNSAGVIQGRIVSADNLYVSGTNYPGSIVASTGTVALRTDTGAIVASEFTGLASTATALHLESTDYVGSLIADGNTTALRDPSGDITANLFNGTATASRYGDLAEKYLADEYYDIGTVISVGGEKEVTAATYDSYVIGTISQNPGVMMNSQLEDGVYIALKGRVPVKTIGKIIKGRGLVIAHGNPAGVASMSETFTDTIFAIALEDSDDDGTKVIEAIVL